MTDTAADPAVGPTSADAEVMVDAAVVDTVRATLRDRGIPDDSELVLLDLDPDTGVSVGRFDPARGIVTDPYTDAALTLVALDRAIADHLVRVGRVAPPTSSAWHDEVLDLVTRGRDRLRDSDGTFLMGRDHIRLFRMARRDVAEAGEPLTARAEDLARAAVDGVGAPAVVISGRVGAWPGLRDAIALAVRVPVVDVEGPADDSLPPARTAVPEPPVAPITVPDSTAPLVSPPPEPPVPAAPSDPPPVFDGPAAHIPPVEDRPDPVVMNGYVPQWTSAGVGPAKAPAANAGPRRATRRRSTRRRSTRLLAALALVCAVSVVGVAAALAVAYDDPTTVSAPQPRTTATPPGIEYADPAILAEARQPARRYTPPPPPETTTEAPATRPRPRAPRPPRGGGITIPNPIPGLPPIVLP
ncbi:hypothetical protein [Gordonia terrae]|uniref:hypothetical protein n=1 Tax=Gordonia terrae TaxID=2055 RepID=UPI003F6CBA1A